jgi:stage III sporulation protein SpoIIIAA
MNTLQITDDLDLLLAVLPERIAQALEESERKSNLIEIVMDLGRLPEARFSDGELVLSKHEITLADLQMVVEHVGDFGEDNRAGIERTLHRISAIRNRKGDVVGLTCRVGRAVFGTVAIIKDLSSRGQELLLMGRPGVGKTTLLREIARVLADHKRVVVSTPATRSPATATFPTRPSAVPGACRYPAGAAAPGDDRGGGKPHARGHRHRRNRHRTGGRGGPHHRRARRTARGTAHGNELANLLMNPTLSDLVGGIESVTLSDEEARRRGTQKSVLERRAPPTFDVLIEIKDRQHMVIHHNVAAAVDAILRDRPLLPEERVLNDEGQVQIQRYEETPGPYQTEFGGRARKRRVPEPEEPRQPVLPSNGSQYEPDDEPEAEPARRNVPASTRMGSARIGCARQPARSKFPSRSWITSMPPMP